MELNMSDKQTIQKRLASISPQQRYLEQHGDWYRNVLHKEAQDIRKEGIRAFNISQATEKQKTAIEQYLSLHDKKLGRGVTTWMKWSELTYYDILRAMSP